MLASYVAVRGSNPGRPDTFEMPSGELFAIVVV